MPLLTHREMGPVFSLAVFGVCGIICILLFSNCPVQDHSLDKHHAMKNRLFKDAKQ